MKSSTRMRLNLTLALALLMFVFSTNTASAQTPPPTFLDGLTLNGFIDGYYTYNLNKPPSAKNSLYNFNFNHNSMNLNLVELSIARAAAPLGFKIDLNYGDAAKAIHGVEPGGTDVYQHIQEAYVTYLAPNGIQIDGGKYVTKHGAEVIETHANWNYSRGLLFSWAIPYYHLGVHANFPIHDKFIAGTSVSNGWNNAVDNNSQKTVGLHATIKPTGSVTLTQNYMFGAEGADPNAKRYLSDSTLAVNYKRLGLIANYDYGTDKDATGKKVVWRGIAGYARVNVTDRFKFGGRFEYYDDVNGFTTGTAQELKEGTLTAELRIVNNMIWRTEWRRDVSNTPFFDTSTGFEDSQDTFTLGFVYVIGGVN